MQTDNRQLRTDNRELKKNASPLVALYILKMEIFGRKLGGVWGKIDKILISPINMSKW
jgi:hypothetical protein